jgi:hypothetical protein
MAISQVTAGNRILITDLNAFYNLLKGVSGSGEAVTLIYNDTGVLIFQPSSNPSAGTELFQIKNAAGTVQGSISSDGKFYAADGTAGVPGITFEADKDTGLYRSAANTLDVAAGGTRLATFDSTGLTMQAATALTLVDNTAGVLTVKPASNPSAGTELIQIKNAAGTVQGAISSDGKFYAADGTASVPGITFEGDKDTGLYRSGSNALDAAAGGTRIATFDSSGFTLQAKRIAFAKGADLTSGSTITPGTDGNFFHVTGTTTITALATLQAGTIVALAFDAALTLTHNATTLILAGGANVTTAAGDIVVFVSEGSGNWREIGRNRQVTEAMLTLDDNTTWNASTTKHGFLKKLSNTSTEFMNGAGNWATPTGGTTVVRTNANSTTQFTTSSTSMVSITNLTITPTIATAAGAAFALGGTVQTDGILTATYELYNNTAAAQVWTFPFRPAAGGTQESFYRRVVSNQSTGSVNFLGRMKVASGNGYIGTGSPDAHTIISEVIT